MKKIQKKERGFSLIELLIAMGVVLLLVAGLVIAGERSLEAGRETSAVQTVQSFSANQTVFQRSYGGFAGLAADLSIPATGVANSCTADGEIPHTIAAGYDTGTFVEGGYTLKYVAATPFNGQACGGTSGTTLAVVDTTYDFTANAVDGKTRNFCSDSTGTFYFPAGTSMANSGAGCIADNAAALAVGQ